MSKSFMFSAGSFTQPTGQSSLSFSLTRGYSTVDAAGSTRTSTQARFAAARLLCGAPDVTTHTHSTHLDGSFHLAAAGGVDDDGSTPLIVFYNVDTGRVQVWENDLPPGATANQIHNKNINGTGAKANQRDLLLGEADESADYCHEPGFAFAVCHGLIVAVCAVKKLVNSVWTPFGVSICYWQYRSGAPTGWKVVPFQTTNAQLGKPRGSFFQMQGYRVLSAATGPLAAWFAFSDYVQNSESSNASDGGNYFVVRATRASTSAAWVMPGAGAFPNGVLEPVYSLPASVPPTGQFTKNHAHAPYLDRFEENGLRLVCPVGDNSYNNRVITVFCTDEDDWADPANWIAQTSPFAHGSRQTSTGQTSALEEGNQFVGSAEVGYSGEPLGQLPTGDESLVPIAFVISASSTQSDRLNFYARFVQTAASINRITAEFRPNYVFNTFAIHKASQEGAGPFCAHMTPGNQGGPSGGTPWSERPGPARMLHSPNGEHFGHCWQTMHAPQYPAAMTASRIYMGSLTGPGRGTRSIPHPTCTVQSPLSIGNGGVNRRLAALPSMASTSSGNSVTELTTMPSGVAPPPCIAAKVYECLVPSNATGVTIGTLRLTSDQSGHRIPADARIKARFWLLMLPWVASSQTIASSLVLDISLGNHDIAPPAVPVSSSRERVSIGPIEVVGTWIPITLDTDTSFWASDGNETVGTSPPSTDFPLGIRLRARSGTPANPCKFLLAVDYVIADDEPLDHPGVPIEPAPSSTSETTSGPEQAEISGFDTSSSWTALLAGEVPPDAWDQTDFHRPLDTATDNELLYWFTLINPTAGKWLRVRPIPSRNAVLFEWSTGESTEVSASTGYLYDFTRNSPVLVGIASTPTSGGSTYRLSLSIGGTVVATTTVTRPTMTFQKIHFGDQAKSNVCPMHWFGGKVDESSALSQSSVESSLRSLGMLYQLQVPYPPAPEA